MTARTQDTILAALGFLVVLTLFGFMAYARLAAWRQNRAWCRDVDATIEQANQWASETPTCDRLAQEYGYVILPGESIQQALTVIEAMRDVDDEYARLVEGAS